MYIVRVKLASVTALMNSSKLTYHNALSPECIKKNQCIKWTSIFILLDNEVFINSAPFLKVGKKL